MKLSYINFEDGKLFFCDETEKKIFLADIKTSAENKSRLHSHQISKGGGIGFPLSEKLKKVLENFEDGNAASFAKAIIFLRITAELLRKERVFKILSFGEWTKLNSSLAEFLPQFNEKNFFYSFSKTKPLEIFPNAKFFFAEDEEIFLPENKFDAIILDRPLLENEFLLAAKDFGKIFFTATNNSLPEIFQKNLQIFELVEGFYLFELTATPELKKFLHSQTFEGQLAARKNFIQATVKKLPAIFEKISSLSVDEKNLLLDNFISEISAAEIILSDIFKYLYSDSAKQNLNLLKEFLIDYRLNFRDEEKIFAQYKIFIEDLSAEMSWEFYNEFG